MNAKEVLASYSYMIALTGSKVIYSHLSIIEVFKVEQLALYKIATFKKQQTVTLQIIQPKRVAHSIPKTIVVCRMLATLFFHKILHN
jgi:hypothetical protein